MKRFVSIFVCLCLLVSLSSCAGMDEKQKSMTVGTLGGAALGAIIGSAVSSNAATGAAIGALVGAAAGLLAGAVVGEYLEKKERNAAETARAYDYKPEQGTMVEVDRVAMEPATIKAGQPSKLVIHYAVMNPDPEKAIDVCEKRTIISGSESTSFEPPVVKSRNSGTYITEQEVTWKEAPAGKYVFRGEVQAGGKSSAKETEFAVAAINTPSGYVYAFYRMP